MVVSVAGNDQGAEGALEVPQRPEVFQGEDVVGLGEEAFRIASGLLPCGCVGETLIQPSSEGF